MPKVGESVKIIAKIAPVHNRKENVCLWNPGDTTEVDWSLFWQGQLERGAILVVDEEKKQARGR